MISPFATIGGSGSTHPTMKKIFILISVALSLLLIGFYTSDFFANTQTGINTSHTQDFKNAQFRIDNELMKLGGSLQYFGNELVTDVNSDGLEDVVFLVTNSPGGSGTFFYAVAALQSQNGYVGSEGYLLGDRIAPQTINMSEKPAEKNVVVVNYADRNPGEPMTTTPSVGKSLYVTLDETNRWRIVKPDLDDEVGQKYMTLGMKTWVWQRAEYTDGKTIVPKMPEAFTIAFSPNGSVVIGTDCNSAGGEYSIENTKVTFTDMYSTLMYCEGSQEAEFMKLLQSIASFRFDSTDMLIFDLQNGSGRMIFR